MPTRSAEQLFYDALALQKENDLSAAEPLYRQALQLAPDRPSILLNLGTVLIGLGRPVEAESFLARLLELAPDEEEALVMLGACQSGAGHKEDALATFNRALALNPHSVDALNGLGNVLVDLKQPEAALESYGRALEQVPDHADVLNNRGSALLDLDRHNDALDSFARALKARPEFPIALNNRGNTLLGLNRTRAALESFSEAARLLPGYARAHWNESLCRLSLGDFAAGWTLYEWGWQDGQRGQKWDLDIPWWDGRKVQGTLLAWGEQGIGDQILHASMIRGLARHADELIIAVEPRLVPLFQRSFPDTKVIARDNSPPPGFIATQVSLGSIGQFLRMGWEDFPKDQYRYLFPNRNLSSSLRERVANGKCICGISWVSRNNTFSKNKSMSLRDLHPILALDNLQAVDLQYGNTAAERQSFSREFGINVTHLDDIDNFNDIDGLAALIDACDVVVTVSNTTAHLAGALGKPALLMVPFGAGRHWYWHEERHDSPWYPGVRIFRQTSLGNWADVIGQISDCLLNHRIAT